MRFYIFHTTGKHHVVSIRAEDLIETALGDDGAAGETTRIDLLYAAAADSRRIGGSAGKDLKFVAMVTTTPELTTPEDTKVVVMIQSSACSIIGSSNRQRAK
jgi:hypothetical protein